MEGTITSTLLDAGAERITQGLDRDFFDGRFQVLRPSDQDLLLAAGGCPYPPLRVADLRRRTDKRVSYINVLIGRIVEAGILYSTTTRTYLYTAPLFHDYLQRRTRTTT